MYSIGIARLDYRDIDPNMRRVFACLLASVCTMSMHVLYVCLCERLCVCECLYKTSSFPIECDDITNFFRLSLCY